jgi:hypothetical protein
VPVTAGSPICLYSTQSLISSEWFIYNVAGQHVATLNFGNSPTQCWDTMGVARGLYYVKLKTVFVNGTSASEWHKVVVK